MIEGASKRLEQWMHRRVAMHAGGPVLELGAGTLNHLKFESSAIQHGYDIVEPFTELFSGNSSLGAVRHVYRQQTEILQRQAYGRIISIAVLEHLTDLPRELARSGRLLKADGVFQAGIPSQGGFAWWLGWRCTTGVSYWLRNRLDKGVIMRHEHVNSAPEIIALVRYFFKEVAIVRFPLPHHQLSLYAYIEARKPNLSRCEEVLAAC